MTDFLARLGATEKAVGALVLVSALSVTLTVSLLRHRGLPQVVAEHGVILTRHQVALDSLGRQDAKVLDKLDQVLCVLTLPDGASRNDVQRLCLSK